MWNFIVKETFFFYFSEIAEPERQGGDKIAYRPPMVCILKTFFFFFLKNFILYEINTWLRNCKLHFFKLLV